MSERALVLGGGGASGNAWAIGVITGLFDAGLDVTQADLIIGTSAGSTVAAQITSSSSYPHALPAKPTSGSSTSPAARPPRSPPEMAATSAPPGPPTENGSPSRPTATATFAPPRADGSACTWLTCI